MVVEKIKQRIKETGLKAEFVEIDDPKDMYMANIFISIMEGFVNNEK